MRRAALVLALLATGCGGGADPLADAEYPLEGTSTGRVRLVGGVFAEPSAPGSASVIRVMLGELRAVGDLDGDGTTDQAALLVADFGGSGTFTYLAAAVDRDGRVAPVATTLLGDRVVVESLVVRSGRVVVGLLTRGPDEPMAAVATVPVERVFELREDVLVAIE